MNRAALRGVCASATLAAAAVAMVGSATATAQVPGGASCSPLRPAGPPQDTRPQEAPPDFDLATLFDHVPGGGALLRDENRDGVPDRLGAAFVLPADPTGAELAAAAEIAARLGFETMALDLPFARGAQQDGVAVVVGGRALAEAGGSLADFAIVAPAPGEGVVAAVVAEGARWLVVAGGDDDGLLRAARLLAGSLPHAGSLSGPSLKEVANELVEWVASDPPAELDVSFTQASVDATGPLRLSGTLRHGPDARAAADDAFARLVELADARADGPATEPDSLGLRYRDVESISLSHDGRRTTLPTLADPLPPGPVPGRPGAGGKDDLDLSNVFTADGLLGGDDLPDRIDAILVPDAESLVPNGESNAALELAARLGLESTGLTVPLTKRPDQIESPAQEPVMVLMGTADPGNGAGAPAHPLIAQLADSGKIDLGDLGPGHGLIELVPDAFGGKPSLVVAGRDPSGAALAGSRLAQVFPHVNERGDGAPVLDDIEYELWATLSGHAPAGQAAIGLYKLDQLVAQIAADIAGEASGAPPSGGASAEQAPDQTASTEQASDQTVSLGAATLASAEVLVSLEQPGDGFEALVREKAAALGAERLGVAIDDRDVQNAALVFEDRFEVPSEVDRFRTALADRVLGRVRPGAAVRVEARLSEPPEVRRALEEEVLRRLAEVGADPESSGVQVLSAFKQGFSWLRESVGPRLAGESVDDVVIEFLKNEPPKEWPQQAIHTPLRWLHEVFPIDEVMAADLGIEPERIRFEMVEPQSAPESTPATPSPSPPVYRVRAFAPGGRLLLDETFDPVWTLRPYFDRFRDYEQVRVTTGWLTAVSGTDTLAHERVVTDPEWFWDRFQAQTLPAVYDYVMDRHDGNPRAGRRDVPYFGALEVELELSEPDYRLGVDNEIASSMDALHEEVYFGTIEFFHLLGRNARGQDLTYPGRVVPIMRPKGDGGPGNGRIRLTGFVTGRPAVVVRWETRDGRRGERRLEIPKIAMERPSLRRAVIAPSEPAETAAAAAGSSAEDASVAGPPGREPDVPAFSSLEFRVRVDSEADQRDSLLALARGDQIDARMISAEQVAATLANLAAMRAAGVHQEALAYEGVGAMTVWAEWTHEQDPESRVVAVLPANGTPARRPPWTDLLPDGWSWDGSRIVQWDTPIPPDEGHEMLAKMSRAFEYASMYRVGRSYLGRTTWAMDLMPPVAATHWSRTKATMFKPTVVYSARQHANEVSSTSHVLRHAELLLTDSVGRAKLDKVNVVVHPFTNPDGAQLAYDLYRITPDFILHAGYLGSLGMDVTSGAGEEFPVYPESNVRNRIWERWLPDVFLNPHGYPSHQVVQLFSEYSGLVRRGRVTERNWGFNKGWFMPGFGYVDDPEFPRHKDAAFKIREYITAAINSNRDVFEMNQRTYARYRRYGAAFDPDVFRLPMTDSVLIEMPLKGSRAGEAGGRGFNPRITIWSGITEAPDETAYGEWMHLVAKAGLSWDQAILDYLYEGKHAVERSGSEFFGGVTLKATRPRPPKESDGEAAENQPASQKETGR